MKVKLKSSWTHPVKGKTYPENTELEIDGSQFNKDYHEKVTKKPVKKTVKKSKGK